MKKDNGHTITVDEVRKAVDTLRNQQVQNFEMMSTPMHFMDQVEFIMIEKAKRIDALTKSAMPAWSKRFYGKGCGSNRLEVWVRNKILKFAAKSVKLEIYTNQMAETTEVWANGKKVGSVGTLDVMDDLGL